MFREKKVLIIQKSAEMNEFLLNLFKDQRDYVAICETSGVRALELVKKNLPDVILLDLDLEDIKGEDLIKEFRKTDNSVRILILGNDNSANRMVDALNFGADDYVTKPFGVEELLARINARMRYIDNTGSSTLICRDISLNKETFDVFRNNKKVNLTSKEFELLAYFMINKNRILTRDKLLNAVWGYLYEVESRAVDVHVGKLRRKIRDTNTNPLIESVRGFGYRMND